MPVENTHAQYDAHADQWERIRDVLGGDDTVKAGGQTYLPSPRGLDSTDYLAYKGRGTFYNATARTVRALTGAMFRKPVVVNIDGLDNITQTGVSFDAFAKLVGAEILSMGRVGVLTDATEAGAPYLVKYRAEDITNWRLNFATGVPVLAMVVLREFRHIVTTDPFETNLTEFRRVLALKDGIYTQEIWVKQQDMNQEFTLSEVIVPVIRGGPLDFIPFQFYAADHLLTWVQRSPILDLVNKNLAHWRHTADLDHGAHFTALPTPWIAGDASDDEVELRIGATTAWSLEEGATVGMLEYTGHGLDALMKLLEKDERHMAVLGARLLEEQQLQPEKAGPVLLRHQGEHSVLASIAMTESQGLANNLRWYLMWLNQDAVPIVDINRDFLLTPLSSQDLMALVGAWQGGAIGGEVLHYNLQQGEALPPGMTFPEMQEDAATNGPGETFMGRPGDDDDV